MEKKSCFIITPVGDENDPIRRHIDGIINEAIIPVFKDMFNLIIPHRIKEIGSINAQILKQIYNCDLVIANLTNLNPNVMYELAFRHSMGRPAIVIAQEGTKIPFDVIDSRTIFYKYDPLGMEELRKELYDFYIEIDFNKSEYGPIIETFMGIGYENKINKLISDNPDGKDIKVLFNELLNRLDKSLTISESLINEKMSTNNKNFINSPKRIYIDNIENQINWEYYKLKEKLGRIPTEKELMGAYFNKYKYKDSEAEYSLVEKIVKSII